ncbi:YbaK/EbsC family protein [Cryptosporangium aurantiacum]|uniref:Cys-tRNA(Pro) deacylase, prolyl-tRNA editing enzyme YbaK/EbsC n=1 Tax=Cryptosporangium aurantiacum TaxID=134849 RepID=A0A1M7N330_9ACTN|nr:YbaK/EbsC family protein [Cryptosporangium aurantiacum]SHM97926.1 Cys-tRNA(Pro) deacylase, prolyl-tRNA editing enzyme YbaK/EbsC [Cryptosporangium aurantiacum]
MSETLAWLPAADHPELLAPLVTSVVEQLTKDGHRVEVAAIDPSDADTEAFCARYGEPLGESANCVVVAGKRGGVLKYAACLVLATTRADINGLVRRHLDVRKVSFAPLDEVVAATGMAYGGVTPLGLPADWPVLIDAAVAAGESLVIGSGLRESKLRLGGSTLAALPTAEVLEGLGR